MSAFENIENELGKIKNQTTTEMDERILIDAITELNRASKVGPSVYIRQMYFKIAAIIVVGVTVIGAALFITRDKTPQKKHIITNEQPAYQMIVPEEVNEKVIEMVRLVNAEENEQFMEKDLRKDIEHVMTLARDRDVNGLLATMDGVELQMQMVIANYLGQIGDERIAERLEELGIEQFPDEPDNFFELTAERIRARLPKVTDEINEVNIVKSELVSHEPCEVTAEPNLWHYSLNGYLFDEINEPISSAKISFITGDSRAEAITDDDGWYEVTGLPGNADLSIVPFKDGYGYNTFNIDPFDGNSVLDIQIFPQAYDIYNKPAPELIVREWLNTEAINLNDLIGRNVLLCMGLSHKGTDPYKALVELNENIYDTNNCEILIVYEYLSEDANSITDLLGIIESQAIQIPIAIDEHMDIARDIVLEDELSYVGNRIRYKRKGVRTGGATHSIYQANQRPCYFLIDPNGILQKCIPEKELKAELKEIMNI